MPFSRRLFIAGSVATMCSVPALASGKSLELAAPEGVAGSEAVYAALVKIYARAGFDVKISQLPSKRALHESSSGIKDGEAVRVAAIGEKFSSLIRVPTPVFTIETTAVVKAEAASTVTSVGDVKTMKAASIRGIAHSAAMAQQAASSIEVASADQLVQMVNAGRVDVGFVNPTDAVQSVEKLGLSGLHVVDPPLSSLELFTYLHEKHANIVPQVDAIIAEMAASGELATLMAGG